MNENLINNPNGFVTISTQEYMDLVQRATFNSMMYQDLQGLRQEFSHMIDNMWKLQQQMEERKNV